MSVEADRSWRTRISKSFNRLRNTPVLKVLVRLVNQYRFTSLTRRIVVLNFLGLAILVSGIFYLNQFRAGLIGAKVKSLETQGEIIGAAISASASVETDRILIDPESLLELQIGAGLTGADAEFSGLEFEINPEKVAPVLRHLVEPTGTRARIYSRDGSLILDSKEFYSRGQFLRYDIPSLIGEKPDFLSRIWQYFTGWFLRQDLPIYEEIGRANGKVYPEVITAFGGTTTPIVRVTTKGELIITVAVPVRGARDIAGVLLLSTQGGEIDSILAAERIGIVRVSLVALGVTILLAFLLAGQIAGPMRRLSDAAEAVRRSIRAREEIPDFTHRSDEIGHLSGALRDMTSALYRRIDAIESFAADVSHELKNPLTSLKSAAETISFARNDEERGRLVDIINHDVKRLDRLISDISDASRLDAELAREVSEPVDMIALIDAIANIFNDVHRDDKPKIVVNITATKRGPADFVVHGHESRLGQVIGNLLDNAISFSPEDKQVYVNVRRKKSDIVISVEDEGSGIDPENLEKIFARFYTDRPGVENFGNNSGLGLNISRQIISAHGGKIWAENRVDDIGPLAASVGAAATHSENKYIQKPANIRGACFIIRLPTLTPEN